MKNTRSIRKELAHRQYHIPDRKSFLLYHFLSSVFIANRYNPRYTVKDSILDCPGPCFVIWNHQARMDHAFIEQITFPRRINFIVGYSEFFRGHLHTVLKMGGAIPKRIFTLDYTFFKAVRAIIKEGGCIAFAPEGMHSLYGTNQPVVPATGSFLKHFGIPVYCVKLSGSYLSSTRVCEAYKKGRVDVELSCLFMPDELKTMTAEEINNRINTEFRHDSYEWTKKEKIKWKHHAGMCTRLSDICYRCPQCGSELEMICKAEYVQCAKCGNGFTVNDYYEMIPFDETCVIPESPSKWVAMERESIIREIRDDRSYSFTVNGKLGYLPDDRYLKKRKTSEICGEGELTVDHQGLHYQGTRFGTAWSFDLQYCQVYSLAIMTDTSKFGIYVNNDYYEFYPQIPCVGKLLLLTEEMHRLHCNLWKNFPWFDYAYPEKGGTLAE